MEITVYWVQQGEAEAIVEYTGKDTSAVENMINSYLPKIFGKFNSVLQSISIIVCVAA
jgi:hypothetical protein